MAIVCCRFSRQEQRVEQIARLVVVCLVVAVVCGGDALARTVAVRDRSEIRLLSAADGQVVLAQSTHDAHRAHRASGGATAQVALEPARNGLDIELTFANEAGEGGDLGRAVIGPIYLGSELRVRDYQLDGRLRDVEDVRADVGHGWPYPAKLYSPVMTVESDDVAVSVSLLYPVLEYKHDVKFVLREMEAGVGVWFIDVYLSPRSSDARMAYVSELAEGETRTYRMAVRATSDRERWMETLTPYREYFRGLYGGVSYERDPRPVLGMLLTQEDRLSDENPYGFSNQALRPDVHGWGGWADKIVQLGESWERVLVFTPTGIFRHQRQLNFPFLFTSHWLDGDKYGHAMGDGVKELSRVPGAELTLGMWWGRCLQVMDGWDVSTNGQAPAGGGNDERKMGNAVDAIDPNAPDTGHGSYGWERLSLESAEHIGAAFQEVDLAVEAGATLIGLDAMVHSYMPVWDQYWWVHVMKTRHAGVKFCTEGRRTDIMHTLAPMFFMAYEADGAGMLSEVFHRVQEPHYLADFLLPGHETWAGLVFSRYELWAGRELAGGEFEREMSRVSDLGYVPTPLTSVERERPLNAVASWHFSVPDDLALAPDPCPGDVNGDGRVNGQDLATLLASWRTSDPARDLTRDGVVDAHDLGSLLASWSGCS